MTHSLDGYVIFYLHFLVLNFCLCFRRTGVGDHGVESLQEYEAMHKCNNMCCTIIKALEEAEDEEAQ